MSFLSSSNAMIPVARGQRRETMMPAVSRLTWIRAVTTTSLLSLIPGQTCHTSDTVLTQLWHSANEVVCLQNQMILPFMLNQMVSWASLHAIYFWKRSDAENVFDLSFPMASQFSANSQTNWHKMIFFLNNNKRTIIFNHPTLIIGIYNENDCLLMPLSHPMNFNKNWPMQSN